MKTLLRLFLVLLIGGLVTLLGAYFILTNPGVQKRIIEGKLPEGSSLKSVRVTMNHLSLTELVLEQPDGTHI